MSKNHLKIQSKWRRSREYGGKAEIEVVRLESGSGRENTFRLLIHGGGVCQN